MNIHVAKKLYSFVPEQVKLVFAPFLRRKLILNNEFQMTYDELLKYDNMTEETRLYKQKEKLQKMLIYAYEHTKYYKEIFDEVKFDPYHYKDQEEIERIPLLTYEIIKQRWEDIQVKEQKDFYEVTTGGSTGKPKRFLLDSNSLYKERAYVYHYWSTCGYDYKKSRIATFRGIEFNGKLLKFNPVYNEVMMNPFQMNLDNIDLYLNNIKKFHVDFLYGYPSAITHFCKLVRMKNLNIKKVIKGIFLVSEMVYEDQIRHMQEVSECPILSLYGHSERAVFAESVDLKYTFNSLYGYTELIDNQVVCTGFLSKKIPLIRYLLDDCAYPLGHHSFEITGHHSNELLVGKNGETISSAAINFHSKVLDSVESYQIIQEKKGEAALCVMSAQTLTKNDLNHIKKAFELKCNYVLSFTVTQVSTLHYTKRGKCQRIIQNIKH